MDYDTIEHFTRDPSNADVVRRAKALIARAKRDPAVKARLDKANADLVRLKAVGGTTHSDQTLSNISVQYKNWDYIGQFLMPTVKVAQVSGRIATYGKRDRLASPDDSMANRSTPNEISESRSTTSYACEPYALANTLDAAQMEASDAPLNEMIDLVAAINDTLAYAQEKRHATILTTAANYGSNTATKAGTTQWSDYTTYTETPYEAVATARDACWNPAMGPTKLVGFCSLAVFNKLRRHPSVITDFKHQSGLKLPNRTQLAEYLDLDDLLVGAAMEDTANEGATASYSRIWGKHFGVLRVATSPGIRTAAFGYTLQFGEKFTFEQFDGMIGVKGGYRAKVGLEVDEKILAADTGYLIVNAVA